MLAAFTNAETEVLTHILSHLPPPTLSAMSLVSKRLHNLVTTPHAWRIAFSRYFPGADALIAGTGIHRSSIDGQEFRLSDKRSFARLSALASWRSEYILRTRLLRSLGRGKPAQFQPVGRSSGNRHAAATQSAAVVTYSSGLLYPVSHLHATFGVGLNKKQPLFMHGAVEQGIVTSSDPTVGKINSWGLGDYEAFKHFADLFVGESEWGLGRGEMVGMPNVMDLSQSYGKVYGEACPGGRLFFTSVAEQRGRFLTITSSAAHGMGVPEVTMIGCSICSVWIAKSDSVLRTTNGVFGFLAGFSNGVLAAYALGVNPVHDRRFEKGEATARWVLCPGVPIIGIVVDDKFSYRRHSQRRIWAVVLNALGEVFYLTDVPVRPDFKGKPDPGQIDRLAWDTGRTVEWSLLEQTRRRAKPDPYNTVAVDGSYTPRTSCYALGLSKDQVLAETREIEKFLVYKPKHFQSVCEGWDMRRQVVVDFAGDDRHGAGESVIALALGSDEGKSAAILRYTRRKTKIMSDFDLEPYPAIQEAVPRSSIFGASIMASEVAANASPRSAPRSRTSSHDGDEIAPCKVDWHVSTFELGGLKGVQISAVASDDSDFALIATTEDPLLGMSGGSNTSSPLGSPLAQLSTSSSPSEIPGHRGRFLAVGTTTGVVCLWDMRGNISPAPDAVNSVPPVGMIYTDSPQISCLGLTSLYLVHGGNDGLVQAWDPLASTTQPIRTLNSRFSSRARRRLVQAQASVQGVGNNYYAAGAVVLDPDPTVLRGMVSLGTHLRYWSYSSTSADAYKSSKRRQINRRSERGSNAAANEQKFSHTGRGALKDYISIEKQELEREKVARRKEDERLSGRFGVGLLGAGASEEEMLAYATMLSEEAWTSDEVKRRGSEENSVITSKSGDTVHDQHDMDPAVAEAIRLSLLEDEHPIPVVSDIPFRFAKKHKSASHTPVKDFGSSSKSPATLAEENDLDFALQLSLAEENSRLMDEDDFPALTSSPSPPSSSDGGKKKRKGKGKSKAA
jgi:hypothetical protein